MSDEAKMIRIAHPDGSVVEIAETDFNPDLHVLADESAAVTVKPEPAAAPEPAQEAAPPTVPEAAEQGTPKEPVDPDAPKAKK